MIEIVLNIFLFFSIPIALLIFLITRVYRFFSAMKKNEAEPGTFPESEMKRRKIVMLITGIIASVFLVIVVGFIILLFTEIAYM